MNKLKVLVLSHTGELLGGAERSMLDVLDLWSAQHGINPTFILKQPVESLGKALSGRGWGYSSFDYGFWSDNSPPKYPEDIFRNAARNSETVRGIMTIIEDTKPDVVLTNSIVCPWAALAAHFQEVPHVWFVREYGDLDHGRKFEIGQEKTLRDIGNLSDLVVANSKTLESHLAQYIDQNKLTTLYNPFDLEKISARAKQAVKNPFKFNDSLKLITTNNIAPTKGQLEAVEAVGKLNQAGSNVEICIMGTGHQGHIDNINKVVRQYSIEDKVHLVGSQPDTLPYISLADVGIMASRKEAFGRATFECLAASKPVVGANSGATPEMVEHGVNGYLYEQGNSDSLATELKNYLQDKSLLEIHGQKALPKAQDMMKSEYNAEALYERITQVATSNNSDSSVDVADVSKKQPIHYLSRWFDYVMAGGEAMDQAHTFTFRRIILFRLKLRLKKPYLYLKSLKSRLE
ncbi:MAG: glycosyltransferase [Candidatus Saccharimonadales bacterium]